jgi:membrane-anchored glycerophosphoryl diester phosphodiesterase (GDPDase)
LAKNPSAVDAGDYSRVAAICQYPKSDIRILVLVLMIALLVYCLLEYLVRQAQRQLTGRVLLEVLAGYTVVRLRFADGRQLWTFPELTA